MRWPLGNWLRGAAGRDDPSPREAALSAPRPDPGPVPGGEVRPAAWRDLPQVQRAVGLAPLTAPSVEFARGLAGRRAPDPMLAPLGHDVRADGPAGLMSGIAVPLVQRAPSGADQRSFPAMPPAAPGRGRPTAQGTVTSVAAIPRPGAAAGPGAQADPVGDARPVATSEDPRAEGSAAERAADLPSLAPRTLPVARLATAAPALSATRVADATAPAPVLALAPTVGPGARSATAPLQSAAPGPPTEATVSEAPRPAPETPGGVSPALIAGDDPVRSTATRRTLGESRRLGLGAPLTGRPPSTARETSRPELPVARLARPTDVQGSAPAPPSLAPVEPAAAPPSPPLPRLVVARRSTISTGPTSALARVSPRAPGAADQDRSETPVDGPSAGAAADMAGGAASSPRPLVGDAPIGISRLARGDAAEEPDAGRAAVPGDPVLRLATWPGGQTLAPAEAPGAASDATASSTSLADWPQPRAASADAIGSPGTGSPAGPRGIAAAQRSHATATRREPSPAAGPSSVGRTAPAIAPLVAGRVIRASAPAAPATFGPGSTAEPEPVVARLAIPLPGSGGGGDVASPAPFGGVARPPARSSPAGVIQRDERAVVARVAAGLGPGPSAAPISTLPLARSGAGTAVPDAAGTARPGGVVSWTAGTGFTTVAPPPVPFLQRAVTIDEVNVAPGGEAAGPTDAGVSAGAGGPSGSAGAGGAGTDYEELAEHLYDRIRARLTTELLLDRERAGLLVDG